MGGPSRYLIGIDLGTTNCALAYIDTNDARSGASRPLYESLRLCSSPGPVSWARPPCCRPFFIFQPKMKFPRAR